MPVYALPQLDLSCPLLQQNKQVVSMATLGDGGDIAWGGRRHCLVDRQENLSSLYPCMVLTVLRAGTPYAGT